MAATGNNDNNIEKLEVEVDVQCSPYKFYRMFKHDVNEIPKHLPHLIECVQVLEGDGVSPGTVKLWKFILEGKQLYMKERMTFEDDEKKMISHNIFEGELMKDYKCMSKTFTVTPKPKGGGHKDGEEGSVVKWQVEYVKTHEDAPIPAKYLEFMVWLTKDLDAHIKNKHAHSHTVRADNVEKIEVEVEAQSDADKLYRMMKHDVKEIPKHIPHLIEHIEVLEGDGINAGSVKLWKYLLEGNKPTYCKERMKVVDDENRIITHSYLEGDAFDDYTFFDVTITITPKGTGHCEGSIVKWHVEYVKAHENAPIPTHYLDFMIWSTKDLDAQLQKDV